MSGTWRPRLAEALSTGTGSSLGGGRGTAVVAEYPYYRSDPTNWASNLRALKDLGVRIVSAYVPWRLHEVGNEVGSPRYDFTGRTQPHTDLAGFLRIAADLGLQVLLKPGPYIFAEVRLGGLPDRVVRGPAAGVVDAVGASVSSESLQLPSAFDPWFRRQARAWLQTVRTEILEPFGSGGGPVVGVQLGNEGIYGELELPISGADFAQPAQAEWQVRKGAVSVAEDLAGTDIGPDSPDTTRAAWSRWSGAGLRDRLTEFREALGTGLPTVVNLPLPHLSPAGALEAWVCRATAVVPDGTLPGNTSWAGSSALSDEALAALWFGMRLLRSDTLEDNWGFTWDGDAWATPQVPVHHALLGLAFGSTTVAVYTACTTHNWPAQIAPDPDGLRREGKDPVRYEPPYCPGAPLDEYGELHPNAGGVLLLSRFLERFGNDLAACHSSPAAHLVVDPVTAAEGAWPVGDASEVFAPGPLGTALAASVQLMIQDGQEVDVVLPDDRDLLDAPGRSASDTAHPPLWIVAGGHVMSRDLQARLAARASAGERVVMVGAVPEHDENGALCRMLARAPVTVAAAGSPGALHQTLRGHGAGTVAPGDGQVLCLTRADHESGTRFVFLSNRTDRPATVRGGPRQFEFYADLPPHGAAVLVMRSGHFDGYLCTGSFPENSAHADSGPELRVGDVRIRRPAHRDELGWRTEDGWQTCTWPE